MANQEHLDILTQGVEVWNKWRLDYPTIHPDLYGAYLGQTNLRGADLSGADFRGANLNKANLSEVDFREADLRGSVLWGANLTGAKLSGANLTGANLEAAHLSGTTLAKADLSHANFSYAELIEAILVDVTFSGATFSGANLYRAYFGAADLQNVNLSGTDLSSATLREANLTGADLSGSVLVRTDLRGATLTNCRVYGVSVWDVQLDGAEQLNLTITPEGQPTITVDNLKIAQFIYLLLNNAEIRDAIDTIAKKAVLILGRFTPERKAVLDALKEALRAHRYLPILFDFDKPSSQDLTETVSTLAHLSRFIIVDLTDPSSAPYEVGIIASNHVRPIQALFQPSNEAKRVFAMFPDLVRRYHWVLPPYEYQDQEHLLASLQAKVIEPAEQKAQELEKR